MTVIRRSFSSFSQESCLGPCKALVTPATIRSLPSWHRIAPAVARLGGLPIRVLDQLVHWLAAQPFETSGDRRKLLAALDAALHGNPDKYAGQFATPPTVARLLVALAAPSTGQRVYDPCFGSAGLLTAAVDYVQEHMKDRVVRAGQPLLHIAGVEINPDSYTLGLTRLALVGVADPQLELGNSLERTPSNIAQRDGFDVVLANPPWGVKVDLDGLDHFPIRTAESSALFIQHAMSQLRLAAERSWSFHRVSFSDRARCIGYARCCWSNTPSKRW